MPLHTYIYIYIYMCVCVCVCVYIIYIFIYTYMYVYIFIYNVLITQSALASERNSVVVCSNPTQTNFLELLLKILQC